MDFTLSAEQQAFMDSARAFAEDVLAPNAARWDAEAIFPKDALAAAGPGAGRPRPARDHVVGRARRLRVLLRRARVEARLPRLPEAGDVSGRVSVL